MTVTRPERPPTPLETAKQHVEQAFGPRIAKRLDAFEDGTLHVRAGALAGLLAWLADFVVYLVGAVVAVVALAAAMPDLSDNAIVLVLLGLLLGVPLVYGLCYGNGRALGAVLTGTRLVRVKNGQRLGASASWAMLVRTLLFPLLLVVVLAGAASGGGTAPGSLRRTSIDDAATQRLHAAGFLRLPAPA